jgi:hypothetical protein
MMKIRSYCKFNEHRYGGTPSYRAAITSSSPGRNPNLKIPTLGTGGLLPYRAAVPPPRPWYLPRGKVKKIKNLPTLISSSSKPPKHLKGSSPLLVFDSFPRTPTIYGMFLLRSPNYFLQNLALSHAIINLGLCHIWTIFLDEHVLCYYLEEILLYKVKRNIHCLFLLDQKFNLCKFLFLDDEHKEPNPCSCCRGHP